MSHRDLTNAIHFVLFNIFNFGFFFYVIITKNLRLLPITTSKKNYLQYFEYIIVKLISKKKKNIETSNLKIVEKEINGVLIHLNIGFSFYNIYFVIGYFI